mmetsp:Transcript_11141/g.24530  ORF Transcript_11141/g.24530 Transcript_11141/m.24530 type:complete len:180 (+) Transcript_11141:92-631(+)
MQTMQLNSSAMLLLLTVILAASSVSAFLPTKMYHHHVVAASRLTHQSKQNSFHLSQQHGNTRTSLQMNYSPDEKNNYNDVAFGLVSVIGGFLSQDVDFVAAFVFLSAIAATGTSLRFIEKDERAPAAVAMITLLVSPVISSLRQTGSLEHITPPLPVEIGLCTVSAILAFVNWSREKSD